MRSMGHFPWEPLFDALVRGGYTWRELDRPESEVDGPGRGCLVTALAQGDETTKEDLWFEVLRMEEAIENCGYAQAYLLVPERLAAVANSGVADRAWRYFEHPRVTILTVSLARPRADLGDADE